MFKHPVTSLVITIGLTLMLSACVSSIKVKQPSQKLPLAGGQQDNKHSWSDNSWAKNGWTELQHGELFNAYRQGRFFVVELNQPHQVLSTSRVNGGQQNNLKYLVNQQSMEARADISRLTKILASSAQQYQQQIGEQLNLKSQDFALMSTAANMQLLAHKQSRFNDDDMINNSELVIDVFVTAGVKGNAMRAGDTTSWYESQDGNKKSNSLQSDLHGTINIMLLINQPLTAGVHTKLAIIASEAKSAALQQLAISSRFSRHLATGTGTDQLIIASPWPKAKEQSYTSGSGHLKLGELVGGTTQQAVLQALTWQNGLSASSQANIYSALKRFGLTEKVFQQELKQTFSNDKVQHALNNHYSLTHDNRAAASAYAFASVLDRFNYKTLTPSIRNEVLLDHASMAAVAISGRAKRYSDYWQTLNLQQNKIFKQEKENELAAVKMFVNALILGFTDKWSEAELNSASSINMPSQQKRIALLHLAPKLAQLEHNTAQLKNAIKLAAKNGAQWITTPELVLTGYRFSDEIGSDWIRSAPDKWMLEIQQLVDDLDVVLFLSHVEKADDGKNYNTLFVINCQGEIIHRHHKINTIPVSEAWSSKGDQPSIAVVDGKKIGLLICADAWPKQHAKKLKKLGAEFIISSANWAPGKYGPGDSWKNRSLETNLPILINNRTGLEQRSDNSFDLRQAISVLAVNGQHIFEHQSVNASIKIIDWDFAKQELLASNSIEIFSDTHL